MALCKSVYYYYYYYYFVRLTRVQEIESKKREKEAALARHKRMRKHRRRLLAKCNYKGQPNLASRVQLLLEKIEASRNS